MMASADSTADSRTSADSNNNNNTAGRKAPQSASANSHHQALAEVEELRGYTEALGKLKDQVYKLKQLEVSFATEEAAYQDTVKKYRNQLSQLTSDPKWAKQKVYIKELQYNLDCIERARPRDPPLLLTLSLGSANFNLLDRQRLKYKKEYEDFKLQATLLHLILSLLRLFARWEGWIDTAANFLPLYAYSTLTLREHILVVNGSNIRTWWIGHHYVCIVLAAVQLMWSHGESYEKCRSLLLSFSIYIATTQALQYRYQMSRLYTLRALSRIGPMEITTESAQVHLKNGMTFLLPFLFIGYAFQFYLSFFLYQLAVNSNFSEWQVIAMSGLYALLGVGNVSTTLYTVYIKWLSYRGGVKSKRV